MDIQITKVTVKEVEYQEPIAVFTKFHNMFYSALLTGRGMSDISRYSYIGIIPHTIVRFEGENFNIIQDKQKHIILMNFWQYLNEILQRTNFEQFEYPANICGGIGYLSYEALHTIEKIKKMTVNNYAMPLLELIFYNEYFVFDHRERNAFNIKFDYEIKSRIENYESYTSGFKVKQIRAECNYEEYTNKVSRIKDYILEGDAYEVNLSQQIHGIYSGNPFALFTHLFTINDAPFSAYINFGDLKVICNSPELFLRCSGKYVETRPIKGTIKRGTNIEEDEDNKKILLSSQKDQAELYMIVDLLRNDLGKVCEYGSVKVDNPKRLEAFKNVYHLVGIVSGTLRRDVSYFDLLKATFPGGSITGCPKVRCMEIIEEFETYSRNLYTGTIFLTNKELFISNIVIRTCILKKNSIYLNSGGAITIDSDPEEEYWEMVHKLKSLMESIGYGRLLQ